MSEQDRIDLTVVPGADYPGPGEVDLWVESIGGTKMTLRRGRPETHESPAQPEG